MHIENITLNFPNQLSIQDCGKYFSIRGYANRDKTSITTNQLNSLNRKAFKLSKTLAIPVQILSDPRDLFPLLSQDRLYSEIVLEQVFAGKAKRSNSDRFLGLIKALYR